MTKKAAFLRETLAFSVKTVYHIPNEKAIVAPHKLNSKMQGDFVQK
jgi:hypothetical protein